MKIGFIGAGQVATTLSKHFLKAGHEVLLSNAHGPESIASLSGELGSKATIGTIDEAAAQDFVVLCVPWVKVPQALSQVRDWKGRVLVDATNSFDSVALMPAELNGKTSSEIVASHAPGATVLKAFNNVTMKWISDFSDDKPQSVLFIAGDEPNAKKKLQALIEDVGFASIDLGGLVEGGRLYELGAPLSGLHLSLLSRL